MKGDKLKFSEKAVLTGVKGVIILNAATVLIASEIDEIKEGVKGRYKKLKKSKAK